MPGCNSCGGKNKQHVQYLVRMANGTEQRFNTVAEAQAACKGCSIKAVPAR